MNKLPILYKLTNGNKIQTWVVEIEDNKHRVISGQLDGKKVTTEWTVCESKNVGKQNETTPQEQALLEAKAMWVKKLDSGYYENLDKAETGEKKFNSPMLANEFISNKFVFSDKVFTQPKLDGIRCIITKDGMFSRQGKEFTSCPHIFEDLRDLFDKKPDLILDGELYNHVYKDNFNQIVSLVKKTVLTESDLSQSEAYIQYHCYDYVASSDYEIRYNDLQKIFNDNSFKYCQLVRTDVATSLEEIKQLYGEYVNEGYEGQMVRLNKPYEIGKRSKYLLKHKSFKDEEFEIVDIVEGLGNKSAMAGYMIIKNHDGSTFKSNIKGNRDHCRMLLNEKDKFIGKLATVKYFELTPAGVPRFPYVIKINRNDYE